MARIRITNRTGFPIHVGLSNAGVVHHYQNYVNDYAEFDVASTGWDFTAVYATREAEFTWHANVSKLLESILLTTAGTAIGIAGLVAPIVSGGGGGAVIAGGLLGAAGLGLNISDIVKQAAETIFGPAQIKGIYGSREHNIFVDGAVKGVRREDGSLTITEVDSLVASLMCTTNGEYRELEPGPYRVGFPGAPLVKRVATLVHGGDRNLQVLVADRNEQLLTTFQASASNGEWSSFQRFGTPARPDSIAAARDAFGRNYVWIASRDQGLWRRHQIGPGLDWEDWVAVDLGVPGLQLSRLCAATHGGEVRGCQVWGIGQDGRLMTSYQETRSGDNWIAWREFMPISPGGVRFVSVTTTTAADGCIWLWATDGRTIHATHQQSPGGNWMAWDHDWRGEASGASPPVRLQAVSQGVSRGMQLWVVNDLGELRTTYQAKPGDTDWTAWASFLSNPPRGILDIAAVASRQGHVWLFAVDEVLSLHFVHQREPGGDWNQWDV